MLETDSPSKTFIGVRFVLFGFDTINERKVRAKLIDGGGVGAGQNSQSCTHVIVDRIVYDDPVCVAARKDGKTVVTGLWVDHSFDIGMPVDATSVMYRPPRDLNGIPGAKSLVVCLTGYQRQDRDDIMTMVGLMGAQFSKPLVANKVTHLICYKFEAEKYELAKKMKKIKLVNHRWLEDCLRDWELRPEADYSKSGYELEIMEAEAKDSEEEAEETRLKQSAVKHMNKSPHLKAGTSSTSESPRTAKEVPNPTPPVDSSTAKEREVLLTPGKVNMSHPAPSFNNVRVPETHGLQDRHDTYVDLPNLYEKSPNSTKSEMSHACSSKGDERASLSVGKFSAISYTRKTPGNSPKKSTLPIFSGEAPSDISGSPEATKVKNALYAFSPSVRHAQDRVSSGRIKSISGSPEATRVKSASDAFSPSMQDAQDRISSGRVESISDSPEATKGKSASDAFSPSAQHAQDRISFGRIESPWKGSDSNHEESGSMMPHKKVIDDSAACSRSQKMSHNAKTCIAGSPLLSSKTQGLEPTELVGDPPQCNDCSMYGTCNLNVAHTSSGGIAKKSSIFEKSWTDDLPSIVTITTDIELNEKAAGKSPQMYCRKFRDSASASKLDARNSGMGAADLVEEPGEPWCDQHAVDVSSNSRNLEGEKTHNPINSDPNVEGSNKLDAKPLGKKTLAKKTLGSRPKLSDIGNRKGSLYSSKSASKSHPANCLPGAKDGAVCISASDLEASPSTVIAKATKEVVEKVMRSGDAAANGIDFMDHETEAPEEKDEYDFEETFNKDKSQVFESTHKADRMMEMKHKNDPQLGMRENIIAMQNATNRTESEMAISSKRLKLGELTSKEDGVRRKTNKGQKQISSKAKKRVPAESNRGSDGKQTQGRKNVEMKEDEKENSMPQPVARTSTSNESAKLENPMELENDLAVDMDQNLSRSKIITGKKGVKYSKTKSNKRSGKINSDAVPAKGVLNKVKTEPVWFILSGHRLQRKEFQQVIKRLKGRVCRDSHQWSYQATHLITPYPIRRTEKFFAAAASGGWILKTDYLSDSNQEGQFLPEEPYEWHRSGLSEDGAINLEAPRKWRLLRERTGHGAFYGMRIVVYGECIAPPLDTLKRVVKAGDGTILATSPPYTRFLKSGVDFAVVSPGMPRVDLWVQEFLKYEIPCVVGDYLVEYVCKPGYPLERHVLYNTHAWAEKSFAKLMRMAEEIVEDLTPEDDRDNDDIACQACGSHERGEVMLICGDESGSIGCGVGTHIDCCDPPLEDVPEGDWFCPKCSENRNRTSPSKRRKKGLF